MKAKVVITLIGLFIIQFIGSCCKHVKYFDYSIMSIEVSNNILDINDTLFLNLIPEDLEFISSNIPEFGYTNTFALSCDDGYGGMKHPIEQIEITSNSDFDEDHLRGELLNDLFKIEIFSGRPDYEFIEIIDEESISAQNLKFILVDNPLLDDSHVFSIKLIKSNGDEILTNSDEINWQ